MGKLWRIFIYEYARHVLRRRFLFALLSVPIWILFSLGMGLLSVMLQMDHTPVGIVPSDRPFAIRALPKENSSPLTQVTFTFYDSEQQARAALDGKQIQAYFLLPPTSAQNQPARLVYRKQPTTSVTSQFRDLVRLNLLAGQPEPVKQRILQGPDLVVQSTSDQRQVASSDWVKVAAPLAAAIMLMISVFTSSGYLMQAVVEEKENRTMEILATSASPSTIMSGKILALISVGLTQVVAWCLLPLIAVILIAAYTPFLQSVSIDWRPLGLALLTALPTFLLISSLMATIGASVTESREGQQVSSLVTLPVMVPVMLAGVLVTNPGSPVALFLTFFPMTASLTLLIRMAFATVPTWQIIVSTALLIITAIGSLWLAGRVFRLGMLRYGKRMSWREIFLAVRSRQPAPLARKGAA